MPSLDRPNAPRRLPSGVFIGPHFKRGVIDPSSQSPNSPSPSPSLISPKTIFATRRSFAGPIHSQLRQHSRSHDSSDSGSRTSESTGLNARNSLAPSTSSPLRPRSGSESATSHGLLGMMAPGLRRESTKSNKKASISSSNHESNSADSARSSISTKARRWLGITPLRIAHNATKSGGPPREAKQGFHWQKEISGHWLEIKIGRGTSRKQKSQTSSSQPSLSSHQSTSSRPTTPPQSKTSSKGHVLGDSMPASHTSLIRLLPRLRVSSPDPAQDRESISQRTLRHLGIQRMLKDNNSGNKNIRTNTGDRLNETTSLLNIIAAKQSQSLSTQSSSSVSSSRKSHKSVTPSIPKWQRMLTDRVKSEHSNSSESSPSTTTTAMQLRPPQTTPNPQEMYTGGDEKQYFRVQMTDIDGPNFLPSEARRVNTPPISRSSKNRGFFFDYKAPDLVDKTYEPFRPRPSWRAMSAVGDTGWGEHDESEDRPRRSSMTEWYDVQLEAIEQDDERTKFVNEVPDHLSNSPLCPLKSPSKSVAPRVCPLHGEESEKESEEREDRDYRGSEVHAIEY